ncbi:MAG TPA: galactose oxidase-like domain-containing protein [Gemmatimonadales bacterium]|nr:galactose oxidase-like domain-containing protein [Gemmatimonadales bacterium]
MGAASLRCGGDTGPQDVQPASLAMVSGNGQNGPVGVALPDSLVVIVKDSQGQPLKGVAVDWSANGSVSSSSVTSGADGHAAVRWTLGNTAGAQSASATAGDLPAVAFTATAEAPVPLAIVVQPPDSALDKEVLAPDRQPVLLVRDAQGALANGVTVTAAIKSGGGTLEGVTSAVSGADGKAAFADLGINGTGSHTLEFTAGSNSVTSSSIDVSALPPEATSGSWGPLVPWDIVPLHMHLLPNGKILGWGKYDNGATGTMGGRPRLWDPASGDPLSTAQMVQVDTMLFCSGHAFMPDGKLMVSGGHKDDDKGIDVTNIFDPGSGSFTSGPKMAFGRWYPTVTELPDGRMLTMAGRDSAGNVVTIPEIWESDHWVKLPGAVDTVIPYYPRNFVDPKNGLIFMAGERIKSRWFDVDGSTGGQRGHWIDGPSHLYQKNRDYGTAVMYDAGKILYAGGGGDPNWPTPDPRASAPTATAEIIDLITPSGSPHWTNIAPMHFARRHLNSTVLPDGTVLVTGGTSGGGFVDINTGDAVKTAELWDPKHPTQWTQLAANRVMRVYHSVSLLLPDGTVLHGASGNALAAQPGGGIVPVPDQKNHEIFSPPYLFKGARPTITSAPATVGIGDNFTVETPNAAQVTDVRWIRIGSVTHAFDAGQRANTLGFTATSTGVSVTAPADHNLAPPGHYMLFILNRNGVPSKGKIIQLQ